MKTTAFDTAFVRIPAAGFSAIDKLDWTKLSEQLQHPAFLEALYIASPALYEEAIKLDFSRHPAEKTRRLLYPLIKYLSRYATRCTPFGLFGGFATVPLDTGKTNLRIENTGSLKRVVRLDMNYLCALAQDLEKHDDVKPYLRFFPNSSLYEVNNQYRYVVYRYGEQGQRMHHLSSADKSTYLTDVLQRAQLGRSVSDLTNALVSDEISPEAAQDFVQSVIDAQLLVSELEPSLTGADFLVQLLTTLQTIGGQHPSAGLERIVALLQEVLTDLKTIENQEQQPATDALSEVAKKLSQLSTPFDRRVLFQIDTYLPTLSGQLNRGLINKLVAKIPTLLKLTPHSEGALDDFRRRFTDKYEDEEIPLVVALDPEMGIGFPAGGVQLDVSPLLDGVVPGKAANAKRSWTVLPEQAYLFQKVAEAQLHRTYQITIAEDELAALPTENTTPLPPTNAAMFSVIRENGREVFVLDSFGGSTGTMLLGRFGHTDPTVMNLLHQISDAEDQIWPDVVFADIVHLPEARTGNIIIRPQLKTYQIPYLGKASVDREHQLSVTDLMIRIRNDQVILRSRSLNKIIVPRLANAHNYSNFDSLDIYHFLCALQDQSVRPFLGAGISGAASMFVFVPRIVLDNLILSEARWNCQAQHVKPLVRALKQLDWPMLRREIDGWREQYRIPRYVRLIDYDNELYIDLENQWLAETFVNEIKSRATFTLKEFLFRADNAVVQSAGGWHTNQFVVAFKNESESVYAQFQPSTEKPAPPVIRKFFAGSDWLYYKIYTGSKIADSLLTDVLYPLARRFAEQGWTDRFFFIRYGDPDGHIRIRFHLQHPSFLGAVVQEIHDNLVPYLENKSVTAVMNDTYNRELERYGANSIDALENYFHLDSQVILQFLSRIEGVEGEECRWRFGMKLTDTLLTDFGLDLKQKVEFTERMATSFGKEFGYNQTLKKQLDTRYKAIETAIDELLAETNDEHQFFYELNQQRHVALQPFVNLFTHLAERGELRVSLHSLLGSLIHMTTNRLFRSRQRFVEYSIYYHLHKQYRITYGRTVLARTKSTPELIAC
ncbi:lantibiotic dehydratase [Spirosoma areae]